MDYRTMGSISSNSKFNTNDTRNPSAGVIPTDSQIPVCSGDFVGASSCSNSAPLVGSFGALQWDHPTTTQNPGFSETNVQNSAAPSSSMGVGVDGLASLRMMDMCWNPPSSMLKGGIFLPNATGILPQSLSHFPADSAFIDRAARFSFFNAGSITDMMNPFGIPETSDLYTRSGGVMQEPPNVHANSMLNTMPSGHAQNNIVNSGEVSTPLSVGHMVTDGTALDNERSNERIVRSHDYTKGGGAGSGNDSDEVEFSGGGGQDLERNCGDMPAKSPGSNKRKRNKQDPEPVQAKGHQESSDPETQPRVDQKPATSKKTVGKQKQGSQASDPPKEEYIHVRARRGQATNSHSLAERMRREKISERMKFLQDLVPGCSKVTGKAVMLDEIINYVQSLQRQVEFLSMKLATVNPRMDFNMESLLAKDILQSQVVSSSTLGYPPEMQMAYPQLHPSQSIPQAPFLGMESHSDLLRRTINAQLTTMAGGLKEPTQQLPNGWDDELNNVVQMNYVTSAPPDGQDVNAPMQPGQAKVEL